MQAAIHFCAASMEEKIILRPISEWTEDVEQMMFIVRTEKPLQDAQVQLVTEGGIVWSSALRLEPDYGLDHPYKAADDQSLVYVSARIATKDDIVVSEPDYIVWVAQEETVISEIPFRIAFLEAAPVEQESEIDFANISSILNSVEEEEQVAEESRVEVEGSQAEKSPSAVEEASPEEVVASAGEPEKTEEMMAQVEAFIQHFIRTYEVTENE